MLANRLISKATGVQLHDYGCSLKVFRAEVVKPLRLYGEMHRFLPAIASEIGVTIAEMVVNHRARAAGTSKYGISRTIRVVLDLLTVKFLLSYSTRPLQIFGLLGLVMAALGVADHRASSATSGSSTHQGIGDRPLLLLGVLLVFIGVQLVTFGLLAEMHGAHLLRVAGQADLRDPRGPRERAALRRAAGAAKRRVSIERFS